MIDEREATEAMRGENAFTLEDLLRTIWNRLWIVLVVPMLFAGAAVGFSLLQTPVYESSITVAVVQEQISEAPTSLQGSVEGLQQLTQTMEVAVDSRRVANAVIEQLGLNIAPGDFRSNMTVEQIGATSFIEVRYRDPSPEQAQRAADAIGAVSSEEISEEISSVNGVTARVFDSAALPSSPVSPNIPLNVFFALVVGLMLGAALAFLVEYFDDSWGSAEEVEQVSGVPTFGVVPQFKVLKAKDSTPAAKKGKG